MRGSGRWRRRSSRGPSGGAATHRRPPLEVALDGHPHLGEVVRQSRRRLRANRTLQVAGPALVIAGAVGLAWALLSRITVLPSLGGWVAGGAALGLGVVLLVAATRRVPAVWAAWAADRWTGTRDAFATAVELLTSGSPAVGAAVGAAAGDADTGRPLAGADLHAAQIARAEAQAAGAVPLPGRPVAPTRLLGIGAGLVLVAGALSVLPNPQDAVRAERAADRAAVEAAAEDLVAAAEDLRPGIAQPERAALAEDLEQLAEELPDADLAAALERLETARAELLGRLDADLAAQRTALAGLSQELGREPLAGGGSAQAQLEQLAAAVEGGEVPDAAALAERLEQLADALAAGAPDIAEGLQAAGQALASGNPSSAAGALRGTAESVTGAVTAVDGQNALGEAAGAAGAAAGGLRGRQAAQGGGQGQGGQGQGEGQGQGAGQGQGQGAGGQGQGAGAGGQGQGAGQGQGQGAGAGGGGAGSGDIGSGGDGDGGDGGQGGAGRSRGGEDTPGEGDADLTTVFDPAQRIGGPGEELPLGGTAGPGGTELEVGTARGTGDRNLGLVPYRDVLGDYAEQANRTIEQPGYPLRLRTTVRDYFDQLGGNP